MSSRSCNEALLALIERRLRGGASIEIDGFGSFKHDRRRQVVFKPSGHPVVFLAYAQEDRSKVKKLYQQLHRAGIEAWMDCQRLLPGQNWPRAIEHAIELSDFFLGCFSCKSTPKRGHFQSELAFALDVATRFPQDQVFFVPVRLDDCKLPHRIANTTHYVDLFPDWNTGVRQLVTALRRQHGPPR